MTSEMSPHIWFPEPKLSFHPDRTSDRDVHPLRGLVRFGPHSAGSLTPSEWRRSRHSEKVRSCTSS
jgi:hypothetical protein